MSPQRPHRVKVVTIALMDLDLVLYALRATLVYYQTQCLCHVLLGNIHMLAALLVFPALRVTIVLLIQLLNQYHVQS